MFFRWNLSCSALCYKNWPNDYVKGFILSFNDCCRLCWCNFWHSPIGTQISPFAYMLFDEKKTRLRLNWQFVCKFFSSLRSIIKLWSSIHLHFVLFIFFLCFPPTPPRPIHFNNVICLWWIISLLACGPFSNYKLRFFFWFLYFSEVRGDDDLMFSAEKNYACRSYAFHHARLGSGGRAHRLLTRA